ncbi:nucleosome assembly protein 1-like 1 [Centruroides sculpturatus]|uniref:nucleosome assembly protein 1-like 1 n=1 Tax=Centruroides sculpturatus TaxID=218467 RepID=UPI000C6D4885|nr:nucleosome assembly protein 1-like 1 [Centruroides sculpturatus]
MMDKEEIGDLTKIDDDICKCFKEEDLISFIPKYHPQVQKRIQHLRKLQLEYIQEEMNYYNEIHNLEVKYARLFAPIFKKRQEIINGIVEVSEEGESRTYDTEKTVRDKEEIEIAPCEMCGHKSIKGVPYFWLVVLTNSSLRRMISLRDEPILKHLKDIKLNHISESSRDYVLEFHFEPNEYFNNAVLTKEYSVTCDFDPKNPYCYEGPSYVKSKGCFIDWKEGKDITLKVFRGNEGSSEADCYRSVATESFFNFFKDLPELNENQRDDEKQLLLFDYEIGEYIKGRIIPKAILYYTEEINDDYGDSDTECGFIGSHSSISDDLDDDNDP